MARALALPLSASWVSDQSTGMKAAGAGVAVGNTLVVRINLVATRKCQVASPKHGPKKVAHVFSIAACS